LVIFCIFAVCYVTSIRVSIQGKDNERKEQALPKLDWKLIQTHLMFSYAAYCQVGLQNWTCYWCTQCDTSVSDVYIISNSSTNIYGYAGVFNDTLLVSFRGTQLTSLKNWIEDLSFAQYSSFPSYVTNSAVHSGFLDAYLSVEDQVWNAVDKLTSKYHPKNGILLSGHSLGGALAVLAAADLAGTYSNMSIFNFGQPRVGNSVFAQYITSNCVEWNVRVVNQRDVVPHLPPRLLSFYHSPTEVWFEDDDKNYRVCSSGNGEDPNCSDSVVNDSVFNHIQYLGFDERDGHSHGCGSKFPSDDDF